MIFVSGEFVANDKVPEDAFAPNVRYRKPARSQRYFESFKTPLSSEQVMINFVFFAQHILLFNIKKVIVLCKTSVAVTIFFI